MFPPESIITFVLGLPWTGELTREANSRPQVTQGVCARVPSGLHILPVPSVLL